MLIPYGTDTPIYYWPIATVVLIVVNVFAYPMQLLLPDMPADQQQIEFNLNEDGELDEDAEFDPDELVAILQQGGFEMEQPGWLRFALSHGDGLHPLQWLTSFFIHGGILHLLGNMIFLWAFGLIVEGKVGPYVFTALYLGIGVVQNVIEQIIFLPFPTGPSLGASSAIYGIMMVALLWAPQDNLKCMMNFWYYIWLVEIPIAMFGLVYFLWDFSFALFSGFSMGTALLHVMGALTGLVPGVAFLLFHWVDGEQRDLISMFREVAGKKPLKKPKSRKEVQQEQHNRDLARANRKHTLDRSWQSMDTHLNAGNVKAATELFRQMRKLDPKVEWNEPLLLRVISGLQQKQDWEKVEEYSSEYLQQFETKAAEVQLNLARMYVMHKASPRKAIKTVNQLDANRLSEKQISVAKNIVRKAQEMIADGVIELGED